MPTKNTQYNSFRPLDISRLKRSDVRDGFINVRVSKYDGYAVPLFDIAREVVSRSRGTYVIENTLGHKVRPDNMSTKFRKVVRTAGIEPITLYEATRHTFASWLVQHEVSITQVSQWLGHKDISTTMIYAHLAPGMVPQKAYDVFKRGSE